MRRACVAWLAAAIACGAASPALAQAPVRVRLDYRADDDAGACLTERQLRARVVARAGFDPFDPAGRLRLTVRIEREERGLAGEIAFDDGAGAPAVRRLSETTTDCRALGETLALLIGMTIESVAGAAVVPADGSPGATAPPPAPAPGAAGDEPNPIDPVVAVDGLGDAPADATGASRPTGPAFVLAATGLVSVGAGPGAAAGIAARLGVRSGDYSLAVEGRLDASSRLPFGMGDIRAELRAGSLVPCRHWRAFAVCGLATAGALRAAGDGFVDDRSTLRPYIGIGARSVGQVELGPGVVGEVHWDITAAPVRGGVRVSDMVAWTQPIVSSTFGVTVRVDVR